MLIGLAEGCREALSTDLLPTGVRLEHWETGLAPDWAV